MKSLSKPMSQSFSPIFSPIFSRGDCPSLTDMQCLKNYFFMYFFFLSVFGCFWWKGKESQFILLSCLWKNTLFEITGITLILKPLF